MKLLQLVLIVKRQRVMPRSEYVSMFTVQCCLEVVCTNMTRIIQYVRKIGTYLLQSYLFTTLVFLLYVEMMKSVIQLKNWQTIQV